MTVPSALADFLHFASTFYKIMNNGHCKDQVTIFASVTGINVAVDVAVSILLLSKAGNLPQPTVHMLKPSAMVVSWECRHNTLVDHR